MTIHVKVNAIVSNSTAPILPHGTGFVPPSGETPYRWLAQDIAAPVGTPVVSWREKGGAGTLVGGGATIAEVAGYKCVELAGTNSLSIPAGAPLPSSRGTIAGVARLSPAALAATRYGLIALSSAASATDGRITKDTDSRMLFDRLGDLVAKSAGTVNPGDFITFAFTQRASGALAMLNGEVFNVGAGELAGFTRFFVGASGSGTGWLGSIFEIDAWNWHATAAELGAFHAAMKSKYTFLS